MTAVTACGALGLVLGLAAPASAQLDTHSKSPIDITAQEGTVVNAKCLAIWRGAAEAVQDQNRLRADTITIYSRPKSVGADGKPVCGGAERVEADGHVYYVTADRNARGDHAVYTQATDLVVITGDVIVVQGQNVARGDRLTINVASHEATLDSTVTGAGKPGRVRGVFYPDKTTPAAGPAGEAAKP